MLAHPNCPCTRASLAELEILTAKLQGRLSAFVLFSRPAATADDVRTSGLWKRAAGIPGVSVQFDEAGLETAQFGGLVSGQTIVYDPQGNLVFSGGITAARGHQGDNNGLDSVVLAVTGKLNKRAQAPVFGCALGNPSAKEVSEQSWKKS
jgi:glyoxylase-like metal-dependent hydrolase (beta-lactamase superfamily II)